MSCVICVVADIHSDFDNQLFAAYEHAIEKALPLAVVHTIDKLSAQVPAELERLKPIENRLDKLNMPLMILVGDPNERLRAVVYHLRPEAIFNGSYHPKGKLKKHQIPWPGKIISIQELLDSGFLCDE